MFSPGKHLLRLETTTVYSVTGQLRLRFQWAFPHYLEKVNQNLRSFFSGWPGSGRVLVTYVQPMIPQEPWQLLRSPMPGNPTLTTFCPCVSPLRIQIPGRGDVGGAAGPTWPLLWGGGGGHMTYREAGWGCRCRYSNQGVMEKFYQASHAHFPSSDSLLDKTRDKRPARRPSQAILYPESWTSVVNHCLKGRRVITLISFMDSLLNCGRKKQKEENFFVNFGKKPHIDHSLQNTKDKGKKLTQILRGEILRLLTLVGFHPHIKRRSDSSAGMEVWWGEWGIFVRLTICFPLGRSLNLCPSVRTAKFRSMHFNGFNYL